MDRDIEELDREVRRLERTIVGMQNELKRGADYRAVPGDGESEQSILRRQLEGVQACMLRAAQYQARTRGHRNNGTKNV